ncbi:GerAB/ArcD/ProY family transporter [Paenibacillus barengoltzii]|uniref:GerAB/ArcD/ProY family transporter n=1 Tax=Paenibacillus barengoltzii TaxID=343517 RepID=UPI003F8A798E
MNKRSISVRQFALWISMYQIGSAYLLIPSSLAAVARHDAWICTAVAVAIHFLLIPLLSAIAGQMRGMSFVQHLRRLIGTPTGSVLSILFILLFPYLILILTLRNLSDFITISIMPLTPPYVVLMLMLVVVVYSVWSGVPTIGRSAELLFFLLPVIFLLVGLSLLYGIHWTNLAPILEYGWKPVLRGSFSLLAFPYLETIGFLFLVPELPKSKNWSKAVWIGSAISGTMYLLMMVLTIATLSEGVMANLTFASYFVARTIEIGDFFQRFEVVITVFWYISIFFRLVMLLHISVQGLGEAFGLKNKNTLFLPLVFLGIVASGIIWPNFAYLIDFMKVWPLYAMIFGIAFPVCLWIMGKVKKLKT